MPVWIYHIMANERVRDQREQPAIGFVAATRRSLEVQQNAGSPDVRIGMAELLDLERTYLGTLAMRENATVLEAGKYAVYGLARAMAHAHSPQEAIENVGTLSLIGWFDHEDSLRAYVSNQAHVEELYISVQAKLAESTEAALKSRLIDRENGAFTVARNSQIDQRRLRTLEDFQQHGFSMQLTPEGVETIRLLHQQNSGIPLLELVNRQKVFRNSSISSSIATWIITHHDIMDHGLYPTLARQEGIVKRYDGLMQRLGNPLDTDILSHKGEVVATLMYGWRESHFAHAQYPLEYTMVDMIAILQNSTNPTQNQRNALEILQSIDPASPEGIQISTLWNQELYTFDYHMRRKAGPIYELDPENNYQPVGLFDFRDPEFVAFVAESAHMMHRYEALFEHVSFNISLLAEQYLVDIAEGRISPETPLTLTFDQVTGPRPQNITLNQETQDWFYANLWHSVDYTTRKKQTVQAQAA
ncbi:MAG TPA: hypothetical protein VF820_03665 [Patescibacteria group bacterium]